MYNTCLYVDTQGSSKGVVLADAGSLSLCPDYPKSSSGHSLMDLTCAGTTMTSSSTTTNALSPSLKRPKGVGSRKLSPCTSSSPDFHSSSSTTVISNSPTSTSNIPNTLGKSLLKLCTLYIQI